MPTIPRVDSQAGIISGARLRGGNLPQSDPSAVNVPVIGGDVARAVTGAGQAAGELGRAISDVLRVQANNDILDAITNMDLFQQAKIDEYRESRLGTEAPGATRDFDAELEDRAAQWREKFTGDTYRTERFEHAYRSRKPRYLNPIQAHEAAEQQKLRQEGLKLDAAAALRSAREAGATGDFTTLQNIVWRIPGQVNARFPGKGYSEFAAATAQETIEKAYESYLREATYAAPEKFEQTAAPLKDLVDNETLVQYRNLAEGLVARKTQEQDRLDKARIRTLGADLDDALAAFMDTGQMRGSVPAMLTELEALAPDISVLRRKAFGLGAGMWNTLSRVDGKSFVEQMDAVEALAPDPLQPDYEIKKAVFEIAERNVAKKAKAFVDDPAGYVGPDVSKMFGTAETAFYADQPIITPERVIEASFDRQRELSGDPGFLVRVLSNASRDDIKNKYQAAKPFEKLSIVQNLISGTGKYADMALAELKLNPAHHYAAYLPRPEAERVLTVLDMKDSEFPMGSDSETKKTINVSVDELFFDDDGMGTVLRAIGSMTNDRASISMAADLQNAAHRLAWLDGNADNAMKTLFGDVSVVNDPELVIGWYPNGLDEDVLKLALNRTRSQVAEGKRSEIASLYKLRGKDENEIDEAVQAINNSIWLPLDKEDGFYLYNSVTGETVSQAGKTITITLDDIIKKHPKITRSKTAAPYKTDVEMLFEALGAEGTR